MRRQLCIFLLTAAVAPGLWAQEAIDADIVAKIKEEGLNNSQYMDTLFYLTDVYGPRLANTPMYNRAGEWAVERLKSYGLENARMEPWGEVGDGWTLTGFQLEMIEPSYAPLIGYPGARTAGTNGVIEAVPILFVPSAGETMEELAAQYTGKLQGAIILSQAASLSRRSDIFEAAASRNTDERLAAMANTAPPTAGGRGRGRGGARGARGRGGARGARGGARGARGRGGRGGRGGGARFNANQFFADEGVGAVLRIGAGGDGTLFVSGGSTAVPQVSVIAEHYNRLVRLAEHGIDSKVRVRVDVDIDESDPMDYNIIAEIPGTDLAHEVVMVGGHFDSWHSATGATDNASGSACAIEAVRILQAIGVKPRRTIRVALWGYEEGGLRGSNAYVQQTFGTVEEPTPAHENFSGYFNIDNGTGRIRGVYLQGNANVGPVFQAWLDSLGFPEAKTVTINNTGGTDHQSFDRRGLPGFQFIQDTIHYNSRTHHSNMDDYDHILPEDMIQAATIEAAFIYQAAMRDEKLPRK